MSRILVAALAALQVIAFVNCNSAPIYSVSAPGTIRSESDYHVVVSLHKSENPATFKIGLIGPKLTESKTVEVKPFSTEIVKFDLPELTEGDYNVTAEGVTGIEFKNTTKLNFESKHNSVHIQTDKATYKPGDLVRYRVFFLDEQTRPAKLKNPVDIFINDAAQNRIKQLKNVQLINSVYTGEYQLSEFPALGNWEIAVYENEKSVKTKNFEIAKYVLPKFDVKVETPANIAIEDGNVRATIRSKYTYGKPVKGKATISIKPSHPLWGSKEQLRSAEKVVDIDGKAFVEFNLKDDLKLTKKDNQYYYPPLEILAVVEEELTGLKQNSTASVNLHVHKYTVEGHDNPYTFYPGKPLKIQVVVKKFDNTPVIDDKNKVTLYAEIPRYSFYRTTGKDESTTTSNKPLDLKFEAPINKQGIATFEINLPSTQNVSFYSLKAKYLDIEGYIGSISKFEEKTGEYFTLEIDSKKPKLDKDLSVTLTSDKPLEYFVYHIIARGDIIKSELVQVPENRRSHTFKITPTFAMVPSASVFVSSIRDGNMIFEETSINFEHEFENKIEIETAEEAKPGEEVNIKVKTSPNSYVGLLGVDQSVLLLKKGNDLSKSEIFNDLQNYRTSTPWLGGWGRYPGQQSGLVTMTNANFPYNELLPTPIPFIEILREDGGSTSDTFQTTSAPSAFERSEAKLATSEIKVRSRFSDHWIWELFDNTDSEISIKKKVPDTITSWVITGFSLNGEKGLGLTDEATKLRVFQPFFATINLPYSVKRGEVISIPVLVFNYLDSKLEAQVTLDNSDKEFDFVEASNDIEENVIEGRSKSVVVPAQSGKSVTFLIRPNKVGHITLKVQATTPVAGDAVHQMLRVEPEGVTEYVNKAVLLNLKDKPKQHENLKVEIPKGAVPDSEYLEISIVGDILGPTIKNLDKLVRKPYGCGEQNMVNFVPNILVLRYLTATSQLTKPIEEKAKRFLEIGYERELSYKHDDGSYSAFGKNDKSGSTWLTAYVARSFHQAKEFTFIDPKIIEQALDFLVKTQKDSGEFEEVGKIIDHTVSGDDNGIALTSFVIMAFLENKESVAKYHDSLTKGLNFLAENIDKSEKIYSLAIASYALALAKHEKADKAFAKVESLAIKDGDKKSWSVPKNETKKEKDYSYWAPPTYDVEITSYALLAGAEKEYNSAEDMLPIIKWLIAQRNSQGGFSSTQDTVVGLQALTKFAEKTGSGAAEMKIEFSDDQGSTGTIEVNKENSLLLQTHILPKSTRVIDTTAEGKGTCLLQLSYRFNLATKEEEPSFVVKPTIKNNKNGLLTVGICSHYSGEESNMAVMEVSLPSGYTAEKDSFDKINAVEYVMKIETQKDDTVVIIYFDTLKKAETCLEIDAVKNHAVAKQKESSVLLYDYYDNTKFAKEFYEFKSSLCDICTGDECTGDCKK
ncbi:CD109.2 family protein [Megaselia abdita]